MRAPGRGSGCRAGRGWKGDLSRSKRFAGNHLEEWTEGDHPLGRGAVRPGNARVEGGRLALRLDAGTLEGAEVRSRVFFGEGSFCARMWLPDAPGSLTGFFLYEPPDLESEIDVELVNTRAGRALFTVYNRGRERSEEVSLGFDPTAGFHEYGFERRAGEVRFAVDGRVRHTCSDQVPSAPMRLYLNAWWPAWLEPGQHRGPAGVVVDWVGLPAV